MEDPPDGALELLLPPLGTDWTTGADVVPPEGAAGVVDLVAVTVGVGAGARVAVGVGVACGGGSRNAGGSKSSGPLS